MSKSSSLVGDIRDEFCEAELGDQRLQQRLVAIAEAIAEGPAQSLPRATKTIAAREAAYRFLENRRVTMDAILGPHRRETARRCSAEKLVYVVMDTTEFAFPGRERGKNLGRLQGAERGFLGHVALAVAAGSERRPLGVLGISTIVRDEEKKGRRDSSVRKTDPQCESRRWGAMVEDVAAELVGVEAIHVMDREADIYDLIADMATRKRRFVVRAGQNRLVEGGKLFDFITQRDATLAREVDVSERQKPRPTGKGKGRGYPARKARIAQLSFSAGLVTLQRPRRCDAALPTAIDVNVVRVYERDPPSDQPPIEWVLVTSEAVDTVDNVAAIVDAYRARWLIEEYFKAVKTGCAYESRQLESVATLKNMLGVLAVIAWRLLLLRSIQRTAPETPATTVVDPLVIEALAARLAHIGERKRLPTVPTVTDLLAAIARLGGHIKTNGAPGWQVLWRGYEDLLMWSAGFLAGRSPTSCDQS